MSTRTWQMIEGGLLGAGAFAGTMLLGLSWWLPLALFLAFDISALGYLAGPRVGAFTYNLVHNYGAPVVLAVVGLATTTQWVVAVALAWAFHVGVDRALGYGLKHPDSFQHTHLGWIGKSGRASEDRDPQ
jgi:hypothetical protein